MSTRHKNKNSIALDILGKPKNWLQQFSSIRLSNIRVGYQIASFIGEKETQQLNDFIFISSFIKVILLHQNYFIAMGGISGFRLWSMNETLHTSSMSSSSSSSSSNTTTAITTTNTTTTNNNPNPTNLENSGPELIYEDLNISTIDCCSYDPKKSNNSFAILVTSSTNDENHSVRLLTMDNNTAQVNTEVEFEGIPEKISSTKTYLLIAIAPGKLRILYGEKLQPITEIPSIYHSPVIFAASPRWIAVQGNNNYHFIFFFFLLNSLNEFSSSKSSWEYSLNKYNCLNSNFIK